MILLQMFHELDRTDEFSLAVIERFTADAAVQAVRARLKRVGRTVRLVV
jgi:hypothetical protein